MGYRHANRIHRTIDVQWRGRCLAYRCFGNYRRICCFPRPFQERRYRHYTDGLALFHPCNDFDTRLGTNVRSPFGRNHSRLRGSTGIWSHLSHGLRLSFRGANSVLLSHRRAQCHVSFGIRKLFYDDNVISNVKRSKLLCLRPHVGAPKAKKNNQSDMIAAIVLSAQTPNLKLMGAGLGSWR